ncbi:MAG: diguanylate cyclase [Desulfosarcinaceae bacterium]|nr:diguanylate cyclase [Desulfosarcinaceae bacterium]
MKPNDLVEYEQRIGPSIKDPLTGTYNHAVFQILFSQEVERFKRYGKPFGLLLIDIDWFSLYNRRHGPIEGDRVLIAVSQAIAENIRSVDTVARFWADRFSVILPETVDTAAVEVAQRIQKAIFEQSEDEITVSIGIAACPNDGIERAALIAAAEEALQQAKRLGKARTFARQHTPEKHNEEPSTILVVDDNPLNLKMMSSILKINGYSVLQAASGHEALHTCQKFEVDLVLLDIMMPEMDGFETCRRLKTQEHTRMIPVILLTALDDAESRLQGIEAGADDFISRPPNKTELLARTRSLIKVRHLNQSLTNVENVLFSMARAVEAKDEYTQGHIERVANLAVSIGRALKLSPKETKALYYGGALHDIGKLGIPHEILNKPGPLSSSEWEIMRQHPEIGYKICLPLGESLGFALDIIRYHHEKMDGSGYPYGLKGKEIPAVARIMAVADIYDALVTDRPYRSGMSREKAMDIIRSETDEGKLDRRITRALEDLLPASETIASSIGA